MSNDRLWFYCNACGGKVLIAKWWGNRLTPWMWLRPLRRFLKKHEQCPHKFNEFNLFDSNDYLGDTFDVGPENDITDRPQ